MDMVGKIACVVVLCMVMTAPYAEAAFTCGTIQGAMLSCLPYTQNRGPLGNCCNVIQALVSAAKTTQDRRTACTCLKKAYSVLKGIDLGKVAGIGAACGVNIPFKMSLSTDCNKVQ
ncbi:PREDICTED: non-specific lipid-transfer protein 2-like [Nicotiana attenuata]|uniref:Non-specific lipid-transfer protein n=1 Tax=Nicotiana attenuata TaxID=49451 RepID=A0A1J6HZ86_NICAT|nr:PREDICTED: non-specific lipid-transfer protein 2-like [Nicotiana attenuata]OIS98132.1 non-specific lipid-transfer protein 2 [Nicotiana attenuata]